MEHTTLAYVRQGLQDVDALCVLGFWHSPSFKDKQEVREAITRAITHWVNDTIEGRNQWNDSFGTLNIGDILSQRWKDLSSYLRIQGIYGINVLFTKDADADMTLESYDKILVDEDLLDRLSMAGKNKHPGAQGPADV